MDPKRNANCYHQKQRQRHRKTNRIRIHLSTSLPALGTKSHRTHSDNVPVPSFGPRMRCGRCANLGATAVPNWIERRLLSKGARWQYSGPQRMGDPPSENHARGTPGLGAPGSGLTAGASLRKAALNAIRRQPYVQDCSQLRYF